MPCDYWQLESKVKKNHQRSLLLPLAGMRKSRNTERVLDVTTPHTPLHPQTFPTNRKLYNLQTYRLMIASTRILTPQTS